MPELRAKKHGYSLTALLRLGKETLALPTSYGLDLENGDSLLQESGDRLEAEVSTGLVLTYKLVAKAHDYVLTALTKFPPSPVFEIVEGNLLMEDSDALLLETGDNILYTDIRGN